MRIVFKILLFPLSLALTIFTGICGFIIDHVGRLLNAISFLIFLLSAATLVMSLFDGSRIGIQSGIIGTAAAYLISPYGLPLFAEWIISKIDQLNDAIKSI